MKISIRKGLPVLMMMACCAVMAVPLAVGGDSPHSDRTLPTAPDPAAEACRPAETGQGLSLEALEVPTGARSGAVTIDCRDGQPVAIETEMEPGQTARVVLVVNNDSDSAINLEVDAVEEDADDWLDISARPGQIEAGGRAHVSLGFRVPQGLEADSTRTVDLELRAEGGAEALNVRLPVAMNVLEEQPLFRDRFDVDPVLGQFSHVEPGGQPGPAASPW